MGERPLAIGDVLHGFCGGIFGRDHYACCRVEALGPDWMLARNEEGELSLAVGEDLVALRPYRGQSDWCTADPCPVQPRGVPDDLPGCGCACGVDGHPRPDSAYARRDAHDHLANAHRPTVVRRTRDELEAQRARLLAEVGMSYDKLRYLAETWQLRSDERDIWHTIEGIDYLLAGEA